MTSRRHFLAAAGTGLLSATAARAARSTSAFPHTEFEAKIARRDFRDITKDVLPTPSMIVDLDIFEQNLKKMADHGKSVGLHLRPHVKVHKSVDIGKRQMALGAIGLTTATIAESELMSNAGIKGVLWTKQPVSVNNISRAIALSKKDPTFMFVIDDPQVAGWVEDAAAAANAKCRIAVAVYAGLVRQGIENGRPAVELAQKIAGSKHMKLEGYMAYSGGASHTKGWENRRKKVGRRSVRIAGDSRLVEEGGPARRRSSAADLPARTTSTKRTISPNSSADPTCSWTRHTSQSAARPATRTTLTSADR